MIMNENDLKNIFQVSVPIRGLFNLTNNQKEARRGVAGAAFPSPLGDYLI